MLNDAFGTNMIVINDKMQFKNMKVKAMPKKTYLLSSLQNA